MKIPRRNGFWTILVLVAASYFFGDDVARAVVQVAAQYALPTT